MRNENERGQMILQKASDVCRRIELFVVCLVGILLFLELLDVRIDFGSSHSIKLAIFILITGLFIVSDTVMVYLQTLGNGLSIRRLAWNLSIIWISNVFGYVALIIIFLAAVSRVLFPLLFLRHL